MKIKGLIKKLKKIFLMIIIKIYIGISLELLWAVWGSVQFQIAPCSTLRRLKVYRLLPMLSQY